MNKPYAYTVSFIISLCLIFLINIKIFDVTEFKISSKNQTPPRTAGVALPRPNWIRLVSLNSSVMHLLALHRRLAYYCQRYDHSEMWS
jgi:hypothetical protein